MSGGVRKSLARLHKDAHLKLELGALESIDLLRLRVASDTHGGSSLVDEVDRRVGELAAGEVPVREGRGGDECRVEDLDSVVDLVLVLDSC